jgi:ABC-2 type transport system permease protein
VKREFAEHRLLFLYLPILCTLLAMAWFTAWLILDSAPLPQTIEMFERIRPDGTLFIPMVRRQEFFTAGIAGQYERVVDVMWFVFWCSMAFYYLYTLYQQRKDRSILFWNSLPVSDAQTIASKVLAGLVGCHVLYLLCFALIDLYMLIATRIYVTVSDADYWAGYLASSGLFSNVVHTLRDLPISILWSLPVYGWLLLASAWSRRAPFAWATGPWLLVILIELGIRDRSLVFNKIIEHLIPLEAFAPNRWISISSYPQWQEASPFPPLELTVSVLLGMVFLYAAVRLNRSDDT